LSKFSGKTKKNNWPGSSHSEREKNKNRKLKTQNKKKKTKQKGKKRIQNLPYVKWSRWMTDVLLMIFDRHNRHTTFENVSFFSVRVICRRNKKMRI
jgi:hypothetical protein